MSYGIDTIKVGYTVDPKQIDFTSWQRIQETKIGRSQEILCKDYYRKYPETDNETVITLKYIFKDYTGRIFNMLFIEFSLPKLIKGCNHLDIEDWEKSLDTANEAIAAIEGLPKLPDIREAVMYRIDLYANFQVGNDVGDYICSLGKAHRSRRKATHYSDTGVLFSSDEISTTLYDKEKKCEHKDAHGILRLEITIRKKRKIEMYLGRKYSKLGTISFDLIRERIEKELMMLSLDKPIQSDLSKVEIILAGLYTSKGKVLKLLGYWDNRQKMTRRQMVQHGYKPYFIRNAEKALASAGISVNKNPGNKVLPALNTLLIEERKVQKVLRTPSDTREMTDVAPGSQPFKDVYKKGTSDKLIQIYLLTQAYMQLSDTDKKVFHIPAGLTGKEATDTRANLDKSPRH